MRNQRYQNAAYRSAKRTGLRWLGAAIGAALTLLPSVVAAGGGPAGPDANALVRKMLATYKKANSVQAEFEAQILRLRGSEYIQSGSMRFKKPDRIELYTTDPLTGTFHAWADGRTIAVYSGKTNSYTKRTAPNGLGPTIEGIEKVSEDVLGVRSTQILSPLSFILAKDMPREAQNFTYLRQETILGRKTYCVSAKMSEDFLHKMLQSRSIILVQRDIKLWIDAQNNQLVRSASTIGWKSLAQSNTASKPVYNSDGIAFQETYRNTVFEGAIKDDVFRFTPPQGARQLYQERK